MQASSAGFVNQRSRNKSQIEIVIDAQEMQIAKIAMLSTNLLTCGLNKRCGFDPAFVNQRERLTQGFQPAELTPVACVPFNRADNCVRVKPVFRAVDLVGLAC